MAQIVPLHGFGRRSFQVRLRKSTIIQHRLPSTSLLRLALPCRLSTASRRRLCSLLSRLAGLNARRDVRWAWPCKQIGASRAQRLNSARATGQQAHRMRQVGLAQRQVGQAERQVGLALQTDRGRPCKQTEASHAQLD